MEWSKHFTLHRDSVYWAFSTKMLNTFAYFF